MKVGQAISIKSSHAYLTQAKLTVTQTNLTSKYNFVLFCLLIWFFPATDRVCASPRRRKVITSQFCVCLLFSFSFSLLHSFVRTCFRIVPVFLFWVICSCFAHLTFSVFCFVFVPSTFLLSPPVSVDQIRSDQIWITGEGEGTRQGFRAANCCWMALPCGLRICVGSTVRVGEQYPLLPALLPSVYRRTSEHETPKRKRWEKGCDIDLIPNSSLKVTCQRVWRGGFASDEYSSKNSLTWQDILVSYCRSPLPSPCI